MADQRIKDLTELTDADDVTEAAFVVVDIDGVGVRSATLATLRQALKRASVVSITHTASPYTLLATTDVLLVNSQGGNVDIQLPDPAVYGRRGVMIIQTAGDAAFDITLLRAGSETINLAAANHDLKDSDSSVPATEARAYRLECVSDTAWAVA